MSLTTGFDIGLAVAIGVAALALAGAALRLFGRVVLVLLNLLILGGAAGGWVTFALRHSHPRELAIAAGGLTGAALACGASLVVAWALARAMDTEAHVTAAQKRLQEVVDTEAADRAEELERTLARARADSISRLAEEEGRIAEERRTAFGDRERELIASMTGALTETQSQVSQRLADWKRDLDRAADSTKERLAELAERQKLLLEDAGARLQADGERLALESEAQREAVTRLRADLDKSLEDLLVAARSEVEGEAAERRRAVHEPEERGRSRATHPLRIRGRAAPADRAGCAHGRARDVGLCGRGDAPASSTVRSRRSHARPRSSSPSASRPSATREPSGWSAGSRTRRRRSSASATNGCRRSTAASASWSRTSAAGSRSWARTPTPSVPFSTRVCRNCYGASTRPPPSRARKDTVNSSTGSQQTRAGFVEASTNPRCHERDDRNTGA